MWTRGPCCCWQWRRASPPASFHKRKLQEGAQLEIEDHVEKGVHQAPQAEMVIMVPAALPAHQGLLDLLASAGTLLLSLMEKEVALDPWV